MSTSRSRRAPSPGTASAPSHEAVRVEPWHRAAARRVGSRANSDEARFIKLLGWSLLVAAVMTAGALMLDVWLVGGPGTGVDVGPAGGAGGGLGASSGAATSEAARVTVSFAPRADAYVNSEKPDFNYGDAMTLRVDQEPIVRSYLEFDVRGIEGTVVRATIEVFVTSASSQGFLVQPLPPEAAWTEASINHHAAPLAVAGDTKTVPAFAQQTWVSVDVTDLVTGDGVYGFALSGISRTAVSLGSRESDRAPRLTIEVLASIDPTDGPSSSRLSGASTPRGLSTQLDTGLGRPDVMTGGLVRGGDKL